MGLCDKKSVYGFHWNAKPERKILHPNAQMADKNINQALYVCL